MLNKKNSFQHIPNQHQICPGCKGGLSLRWVGVKEAPPPHKQLVLKLVGPEGENPLFPKIALH
jgi:hypothetical protein